MPIPFILGAIAAGYGYVNSSSNNKNDKVEDFKAKNRCLSDDELFEKYRASTEKAELIAIKKLLKERGYGSNN